MMRWEQARRADAREVLSLYRAAAAAGRESGRSEWNDEYPVMDNILDDLRQGGLYIAREGGRIAAAISLIAPDDLDGLGISWTPAAAKEACRFCILPELQGKRVGEGLFLAALALLKAQGMEAVRYLCAKANPAAYRLYTRLGHRQLEDVRWWDTDFYSFEKLL